MLETKTGAELLAELARLTVPCPLCKGTGQFGAMFGDETGPGELILTPCSTCHGSGVTPRFPRLRGPSCLWCKGSGKEDWRGDCHACGGSGYAAISLEDCSGAVMATLLELTVWIPTDKYGLNNNTLATALLETLNWAAKQEGNDARN